jgi:hypothetical protein
VRVQTYIVRIYRRGRTGNGDILGVVETATGGWQRPFRSAEELMSILAAPHARRRQTAAEEKDMGHKSRG